MRKSIILFLLVTLGFSACKKDAVTNDYDNSYKAWVSFKQKSSNSYSYTVVDQNVLMGENYRTNIAVQNGVVITRDFVSYTYVMDPSDNKASIKKILGQWHEDKTSVGVHDDHGAAALLTLDDIYKKAKLEWLPADKVKNDVYFEAKNSGLISSCGYMPKGCTDYCFYGIKISEITAL